MHLQSTRLHVQCATCGVDFTCKRSKPQRYCSKRCVDQAPHPRQSPVERFWRHVRKTETCWLWTGPTSRGYGRFHVVWNQPAVRAHRFAWEITYGPVPAGRMVLHRCIATPACVRPSHLYLGDQIANMADRTRDGRGYVMRGEAHPMAKLTAEQVRAIREDYASGRADQGTLAAAYGVTRSVISHIVTRRSWRHLP